MSSLGNVPCDQRRSDSNIGSARNAREGCCIQASMMRSRLTRAIFAPRAADASRAKGKIRDAAIAFEVPEVRPMAAVRELRRSVRELGFRALRIVPWLWDLPPDDRRY
jgi:hypothetical protein